ncbi:MAG: Ycf66 family protein [Cyanobium sp.]
MVNASLNWASIVGIVLAVGGALLFFLRNFKPALARDTDVFFAAVGLLCGGILFFQGWRLDPILQFGQFLLAGTTVFFAYESVRLRGITTEQARRSNYFEDEEPAPLRPRGGLGGGYDADYDRFDEPERLSRRIRPRDEAEDDFYRPRRTSRAAIPERAASRRPSDDWDSPRRPSRPEDEIPDSAAAARSRYSAGGSRDGATADFGARRRDRDAAGESRRGSRPVPSTELPRSSRRPTGAPEGPGGRSTPAAAPTVTPGIPQGSPIRSGEAPRFGRGGEAGGAASSPSDVSDADYTPIRRAPSRPPSAGGTPRPRDNSSRFDD